MKLEGDAVWRWPRRFEKQEIALPSIVIKA